MPIGALVAFLVAAWFWDVWPFTNGHFRPIAYEHDYRVIFYFPDDARRLISEREVFLGEVVGLEQCNALARGYASQHGVRLANWSYVCCSGA